MSTLPPTTPRMASRGSVNTPFGTTRTRLVTPSRIQYSTAPGALVCPTPNNSSATARNNAAVPPPAESPTSSRLNSTLNQSLTVGPGTSSSEQIRLYFRVRPFVAGHQNDGAEAADLNFTEGLATLRRRGEKPKTVACDGVFGADSTQSQVYDRVGSPAVEALLNGYNGCIFAYGQTGSGKTHTMIGGKEEEAGLISRIIQNVFDQASSRSRSNPNASIKVYVEYVELYMEKLKDLAAPNGGKDDLEIQVTNGRGGRKNVKIPNLTKIQVESYAAAMKLLVQGQKVRTTASTAMNETSSRSHCIYTLTVEVEDRLAETIQSAKLNLVDLAGSESQRAVQTSGQTRDEGNKINLSLSTLSLVIQELQENIKALPSYRNSKLTTLLCDSLGGNCKTRLIATLNPSILHEQDTFSTMSFAERARCIKLQAHKNLNGIAGVDSKRVQELSRKLMEMEQEITRLKSTPRYTSNNQHSAASKSEQVSTALLISLTERFLSSYEAHESMFVERESMELQSRGLIEEVSAENEELVRENRELQSQLESLKRRQSMMHDPASTSLSISSLDCSTVNLNSSIATMNFSTVTAGNNNNANEFLASIKAQRDAEVELATSHDHLVDVKLKLLQTRKRYKEVTNLNLDLTSQVDILKTNLLLEQKEKLQLMTANNAKESELAAVKEEITTFFQKELSSMKTLVEQMEKDREETKVELAELQASFNLQTEQIQVLQGTNDALKTEKNELHHTNQLLHDQIQQNAEALTSVTSASRPSVSPSKVQLLRSQLIEAEMNLMETKQKLVESNKEMESKDIENILLQEQLQESIKQLQIEKSQSESTSMFRETLELEKQKEIELALEQQSHDHARIMEEERQEWQNKVDTVENKYKQTQYKYAELEAAYNSIKRNSIGKAVDTTLELNQSVSGAAVVVPAARMSRASLNRSSSAPLGHEVIEGARSAAATAAAAGRHSRSNSGSMSAIAARLAAQLNERKKKAAAVSTVAAPVAVVETVQMPISFSSPIRPNRRSTSVNVLQPLQDVTAAGTNSPAPRTSMNISELIDGAKANSASKRQARMSTEPASPVATIAATEGAENVIVSPRKYTTNKLSLCPVLEGDHFSDSRRINGLRM